MLIYNFIYGGFYSFYLLRCWSDTDFIVALTFAFFYMAIFRSFATKHSNHSLIKNVFYCVHWWIFNLVVFIQNYFHIVND